MRHFGLAKTAQNPERSAALTILEMSRITVVEEDAAVKKNGGGN
jgi:hypothetical protein